LKGGLVITPSSRPYSANWPIDPSRGVGWIDPQVVVAPDPVPGMPEIGGHNLIARVFEDTRHVAFPAGRLTDQRAVLKHVVQRVEDQSGPWQPEA